MEILTVTKLCKVYPSFKLDDVSFSLTSGHIVGFIGRNGAGKTTTLKCIYNLVSPTSGSIEYMKTVTPVQPLLELINEPKPE